MSLEPFRRIMGVIAVAAAPAFLGCVLPTDRSDQLRVEMNLLPNLFEKDTVELSARLVDRDGVPVPNALIQFSSDNALVATVAESNLLLAVGVGTATIMARAVGYEEAEPATRTAQVRGLLEVDSIRPMTARFGEIVEIFGVGLMPESLFTVRVGGVEADTAGYLPQNPNEPNRLGRLSVWVPPPAARRSEVTILGFNGGLVFPESLEVVQRDLFEPNDLAPRALGELLPLFRNPALAFEARVRTEAEVAIDWYTFDNAQVRDRTIVVFSEMVGAETFGVVVTDSIFWDDTNLQFGFGSSAWSVGRGSHLCDGLTVTQGGEPASFVQVPFNFTVVALRGLPAGRYHVFVPFVPQGDPASYEMLIVPFYGKTPTGLDPDAHEENDYCDVAGDVPLGGAELTVDNPQDVDWFRLAVPAGGRFLDVTARAHEENADLDLYLVADFRPDSLVLLRTGASSGQDEAIRPVPFLPPGAYFLVAVDFAGVPTAYTLTASLSTTVPSVAASAVAPPAVAAERERLRVRRLEAARHGAPDPPIREILRSWPR